VAYSIRISASRGHARGAPPENIASHTTTRSANGVVEKYTLEKVFLHTYIFTEKAYDIFGNFLIRVIRQDVPFGAEQPAFFCHESKRRPRSESIGRSSHAASSVTFVRQSILPTPT
jgi:hypothetical protein